MKLQLHIRDHHVVMDNGILKVKISKPDGIVTGIKYNHIDNVLETANDESNRGYWDLVWSPPGSTGTTGTFQVIHATDFKVVVQTEEQTEISFSITWDISLQGKLAPLNIDKRFIMLPGSSGFYSYAIYEHLEGWPGFNLDETRIVFKLRKDKFHYMAMADNRQRYMPLPDDRLPGRGQPLDYPEAVLLVNPVEPEFKGEVDDKYLYSCEDKDLKVHGWICQDPIVGFWQISPSNEFRTGGPHKQELTSHVGPTTLAMFVSAHYAGEDIVLKFVDGEGWKKVFGPVFIYLNCASDGADPLSLWEDAKLQMVEQVKSWPYSFPASEDFPRAAQRGSVRGRLLVRDRCMSDDDIVANGAYIGLAPPGEIGSWQREGKGYQFWTTTDEQGNFTINNIRTGDYILYAWVPGFIGEYRHDQLTSISPVQLTNSCNYKQTTEQGDVIVIMVHRNGKKTTEQNGNGLRLTNVLVTNCINLGCDIDMGEVMFEPPRDGPTLWEIGIPDRSAREFYIPDPNPKYINKLYINHPDRFRQYGLWERYAELYPNGDLVYVVGESNYATDWFYAQVTRKKDEKIYEATTWQIKFKLDSIDPSGTYKLRLALASAAQAELQVRINNPDQNPALFTTGLIGKDNAIARHGIHGLYWLFTVELPSASLVEGVNTIYLTQANVTGPFQGIMYDYIRLEGP